MTLLIVLFVIGLAIKIYTVVAARKTGTAGFRRAAFMSEGETRFYRALQAAAGDQAHVFVKPRLNDLVYAVGENWSARQGLSNKLMMKHVDFLLCDPLTVAPACAVELDDGSHERSDRKARDKFVDEALKAAGIPIAHFTARAEYKAEEIKRQLEQLLPGLMKPRAAGAKPPPPKNRAEHAPAEPPPPPAHKDLKYMPPAMRAAVEAKRGPVVEPPEPPAPVCPHCNKPMVLREAGGTAPGSKFWGCINYPTCHHTEPFDGAD